MAGAAITTLLAHGLGVAVWRALRCTKHKPLPDFLVFPVPELLVANLLVLPLAMASTVLLTLAGSPGSQVLGALGMAVLLSYLGMVTSVLLGVSATRELLGLRYIEHGHESEPPCKSETGDQPLQASAGPPGDNGGSLKAPGSSGRGSLAAMLGFPASESIRRLVVQLVPRHRTGLWERPDALLMQEYRRTYQQSEQQAAQP